MNRILSLVRRLKQLPRNEDGSILLLSGMMAFALAILGVFAMDTSEGIYNRIISQNAVDGAAETSALWQARGLNLMQTLNNTHYQFNAAIYVAEWSALGSCAGTVSGFFNDLSSCPCKPRFPIPCCECCPQAVSSMASSCSSCNSAGPLNDLHGSVASAILNVQSGISILFPSLALVYANEVAHKSGGDALNAVLPQYLGKMGGAIQQATGIPFPTSIPTVSFLPEIYAIPMQLLTQSPGSVFLNVHQVSGENWPWKWNMFGLPEDSYKWAALLAWKTGKSFCQGDIWQIPPYYDGAPWGTQFNDHDSYDKWGWDDSYYQGTPGFTTWIAGKTNHNELAGLGFLRWLNGGTPPPEVHYAFLNQDNLQMYTGSATNATSPLVIPAFVALASSQVEGTGLVAKDTANFVKQGEAWKQPPVDSVPKLISVYLPGNTSGTSVLIYH